MSDWPTDWPSEVREHDASTARALRWDASIVEAMTASVEHVRALTESDRPRRHFFGVAEGARWFFETVAVGGEQVVVQQLVVDDRGKTHHYSWQRLEDDEGGLTDASLDVADVRPIEACSSRGRGAVPQSEPGASGALLRTWT